MCQLTVHTGHWQMATHTNATGYKYIYIYKGVFHGKNPVYERSLVANLPALKDCYLVISIKCFQPSFWGFLFGAADVETNPLNPSKSHQATAACLTPWTDFKAFSTTPTQAAQVIPVQPLKYHWVFVNCLLPPSKINIALKTDGWKTSLSYWDPVTFQGLSGRVVPINWILSLGVIAFLASLLILGEAKNRYKFT